MLLVLVFKEKTTNTSFKAIINIIFDRRDTMDPITKILNFLLIWFHFEIDVDFWSQYISFILVGVMISASIRGFLKNLMKVSY